MCDHPPAGSATHEARGVESCHRRWQYTPANTSNTRRPRKTTAAQEPPGAGPVCQREGACMEAGGANAPRAARAAAPRRRRSRTPDQVWRRGSRTRRIVRDRGPIDTAPRPPARARPVRQAKLSMRRSARRHRDASGAHVCAAGRCRTAKRPSATLRRVGLNNILFAACVRSSNPPQARWRARGGGYPRFVRGAADSSWTDCQIAALLTAIVWRGMSRRSSVLTDAMMRSGARLDLYHGLPVDKALDGIVGDKTSLILAPLAAACGVPMMSGRGLGRTGGTVDKLSRPGFRTRLSVRCEGTQEDRLRADQERERIAPPTRLYAPGRHGDSGKHSLIWVDSQQENRAGHRRSSCSTSRWARRLRRRRRRRAGARHVAGADRRRSGVRTSAADAHGFCRSAARSATQRDHRIVRELKGAAPGRRERRRACRAHAGARPVDGPGGGRVRCVARSIRAQGSEGRDSLSGGRRSSSD